jgi:hypothetical protein
MKSLLSLNDTYSVFGFLFYYVAEQAAVMIMVVFAGAFEFFFDALGYDRRCNDVRVRMRYTTTRRLRMFLTIMKCL